MANTRVYYGVYDGQVCAINDPENRGRIQCVIPDVTGESPSAWCEPCVPVAYDDGGDFYLPKLKEFVWVMFEHGDPNKPVYMGGWWAENRTPLAKEYADRKTNERTISFFNAFIRMLNTEKKIEIGVTKNDPEIVIEEGTVNIKGFDGGKVDDVQVNDVSVVQDKIAKVKVPTKVSELQEDTNAKIMTSDERNKLSGIEARANVNKVDDVKVNGTSVVQNKIAEITMPTKISDLGEDNNHRTVTDDEKTAWNEKDGVKKTDPLCQALLERGLIKSVFSVDLLNHGEWVDSGTKVNNFPVYKSNASYNVNNAWDTAKVTFKGYDTFRLFIRSFAESSYDYILVSTLNNDYLASSSNTSSMRSVYNNTQYTKAYTRGKQSDTDYEEVIFGDLDPTQEYYFYVIYQKDNSTHRNDDRGYFYIPMSQNLDGLELPVRQNDVIDLLLKSKVDDKVIEYNYNSFTFNSGFSAYSTGGKTDENCPYALKTGKVVNISGAIKPTVTQTTTGEKVIGKVPVGCEPMCGQHLLQQGSGQSKYLLVIRTNGDIIASRYGLDTDTPIPNGVWLNISCSYICA